MDYSKTTLAELREIAKNKGIKTVSGLKKSELIAKINEADGSQNTQQIQPAQTQNNGGFAGHRPYVRKSIQPGHTRPYEDSHQVYPERSYSQPQRDTGVNTDRMSQSEIAQLLNNVQDPEGRIDLDIARTFDSGITKTGILEILPDGFGFIRCDNFLPGEDDVYVSPSQIRKYQLRKGDMITGNTKAKTGAEKFSALLYIKNINGFPVSSTENRPKFENLTPIFPNKRIRLETTPEITATRLVDLISPIGKGQRGMIVSQPKAGKTTLLKQIAKAVLKNNPEMHIIILLIDERPEEVTDMKDSIQGDNVEIIYSTFDESPDNHKRVSEMVIDRAKRLVEHKMDVMILLDSITRLARAYNLTVQSSGRTLSGGLDPAALLMPKKFFGAARNMREGGSLTILATALVDTGSRLDDMVFEEFKGTGNMELVLDRSLAEKRIFPAIDLLKSGTRKDDLLLDNSEQTANVLIKRALKSKNTDEQLLNIINLFKNTKNNVETISEIMGKFPDMLERQGGKVAKTPAPRKYFSSDEDN